MATYLIAGLGNPGNEYAHTRHNAGFMAADALAAALGVSFAPWAKAKADCARADIGGDTIYLLKPMAYMNLSGEAVGAFARFYKIPAQNILVVYDDMSLLLGALRMRASGSAGGQNGMKDILQKLGTQDVPRLRIGIGPRPEKFESKDFVLSRFSPAEKAVLKDVLAKAVVAAKEFVEAGLDIAMNNANR